MTTRWVADSGRSLRCHAGRLAIASLSRLPRGVGLAVGRGIGRLGYWIVGRDRRLAHYNLAAAWPERTEAERRAMAIHVFERLGENIYDVAAVIRWDAGDRRRHLEVSGLDRLAGAMAAGRGVVLVGAHQGAWELVAPALADRGIAVVGLARPISEARLDRWLDEHRGAIGTRTIKVGRLSGARQAHQVLAAGGVLGCLIDHRVRHGGRWIDFFGRPSRFATGPVRLAMATGAAMIPVSMARRPDGGHRVEIGMPLAAAPGPDSGAVVDSLLAAAVAALEQMIRDDPASWAWMHPRWGRPRGVPATAAAVRPAPRLTVSGAAGPALIVLLGLLGSVFGCGETKPARPHNVSNDEPSSMLSGVTLRETLDGRIRWILKADSSETFTQPNHTVARNLRVDFYDPSGAPTSKLTADEGDVQRSNNDMTARGHVVVITIRGDTLTTERLDWSSVQNRVKTDLPFRLSRPDGVLTGVGFESDPDLTHYTTQQVRIDARDSHDDANR